MQSGSCCHYVWRPDFALESRFFEVKDYQLVDKAAKESVRTSLPEDTATVASEIVRKVRFHPTLENFLAVLGSPGPVLTVIRALGPAMVTEPLMVST